MDHDRCPSVAEERVRTVAERDIVILQFRPGGSFGIDVKIFHVAGMVPFRIFQPVFFALRIKMWPRRLKVRPVALGILVEMNRMFSGRQVLKKIASA